MSRTFKLPCVIEEDPPKVKSESPVTSGQVTGWITLGVVFLMCSAGGIMRNVFDKQTRRTLHSIGLLALVALLLWLICFAATVQCPKCSS